MILETLFWILAFLLVYPYLVYPLLLRLLTAIGLHARTPLVDTAHLPWVTFIISAFNEAAVIAEKLGNTLAIDYPAERFEVIVISDASDDGTDEIVQSWSDRDPRIKLVRQNERHGKSAGLNHGVAAASGAVIVFSDANAMYKPDAVRELVKYFVTPDVGYVMGAALYNQGATDSEATESEGLYWKFELALKKLESAFYSVVGGDGAIYAIRQELFFPLRQDDINDFVNPLQIVAKGYRGIFNPVAICYEDAAEEFGKEFRRKRRIANRSWRAVKRTIGQYRFPRDVKFLWTLVSHKVLRWFSMPMILALFVVTAALAWSASPIYQVALAGQVYLFMAAFAGAYLDKRQRNIPVFIYLPYYFYLVYYAAMLGLYDEWRGIKHAVWNHVRDQEGSSPSTGNPAPNGSAGTGDGKDYRSTESTARS